MVEIVAEISGNHGGSLEKAIALIYEASWAGCDYVKFQYYKPSDMPDVSEPGNREMYNKLMVFDHWLPEMFESAKKNSIGLFASVFSVRAVKEILKYDIPYVKLASPKSTRLADETYREIINLVPPDVTIITSCNVEDWDWMKNPYTLYCPEGHPPTITHKDFTEFREGNYWGFSDHTPGIRVPLAFIRAGAEMIEKHFKLADDNSCVDAAFSTDPQTMNLLCRLAHHR